MFKFTAREQWLSQGGTGKIIVRGACEAGVTAVREKLQDAIVKAGAARRAHQMASAAAGRAALEISDDSESSSAEEAKPRKPEKVDNHSCTGVVTDIKYKGIAFKAIHVKKSMYVHRSATRRRRNAYARLPRMHRRT